MQYLKYNTASNISIGTLVGTDGITPDTSRTVTNITQMVLLKEGSAALTSIIANTFTHLANGVYKVALTAADTNTVGKLDFHLSATTCQPQHREYMVVPANMYDSLVGGTDTLDTNVIEINSVTTAAPLLAKAAVGMVAITVGAGASTTDIPTDLTEATNDHYNGRTLLFTSGAMAGQAAEITDYDGTTKHLTVSVLTEAPANGVLGVII